MLSLDRCRTLLGCGRSQSDEEVARIRDAVYAIARVIVVRISESQGRSRSDDEFERGLDLLTDSEKHDARERAAIVEYEAGLPREAAERHALTETLRRRVRHT
jgi:hypothetical protein